MMNITDKVYELIQWAKENGILIEEHYTIDRECNISEIQIKVTGRCD